MYVCVYAQAMCDSGCGGGGGMPRAIAMAGCGIETVKSTSRVVRANLCTVPPAECVAIGQAGPQLHANLACTCPANGKR